MLGLVLVVACSSEPEPSAALLKMGYSREEALASVRVSVGMANTEQQVDALVAAMKRRVEELRAR